MAALHAPRSQASGVPAPCAGAAVLGAKQPLRGQGPSRWPAGAPAPEKGKQRQIRQPGAHPALVTASVAQLDAAVTLAPPVSQEQRVCEAADLEEILKERGACGVGFIANLKRQASHKIVSEAVQALGCMEHRGACSADTISGDGAGIMLEVPWKLLTQEYPDVDPATTGCGMLFLPNDDRLAQEAKSIVEDVVAAEGRCKVVHWREVPTDGSVVGRMAKRTQPRIWQVLIQHQSGTSGAELERELFILRKLIEQEKVKRMSAQTADAESVQEAEEGADPADFYVCSLSATSIVYKGMLQSEALGRFYKDLRDPNVESSYAVYHRRFSTNTNPKWPLAQPMRVLGHNGEINTLQGNLNWMSSRQHSLKNEVWHGREEELLPLCNAAESDSANLDHVAELLMRTGVDPCESLMVLVPEAYHNHPELRKNYPEVEAFYEFYEGLQEGWDGPALLVFASQGKIGARLDRNGLRPARFWRTSDDLVYVASEVGVLNDALDNAPNIIAKGRLGPGQMVCADLNEGTFKENAEIAREVAGFHPYGEWLQGSQRLADLGSQAWLQEPQMGPADALKLQAANGLGQEDTAFIIEGMAQTGAEPTYCMGDDIPLPVLSSKAHPLYNYFKQRFAQVTNPPIDPLREGLVMSLQMRLGARGNLLHPHAGAYKQILLETPILLETELDAVKASSGLSLQSFSLHYKTGHENALKEALAKLCQDVEKEVRGGCEVVLLTDRLTEMKPDEPPIPSLLATGAVHHHLIRTGLRTDTSIVVESAQCVSTHHVCMLIGYGAHAISPYMAFEVARQWRNAPRTQTMIKSGKVADLSIEDCQLNLKKALEKGTLKILSKMGISLLSCYHGAQIFEAYGLGPEVIDVAFRGSVSRVGGMTLADLQRESESFWAKGFPEKAKSKLDDYGFIQSRPKGEVHANNQQMSKLLHKAIGLGGKAKAPQEAYAAYQSHFQQGPTIVLRDCLELVASGEPIPLDQVQSAGEIMERFCTGGMSLGAISRETHETIAVAMNRIKGKSNSGEGGEDPLRWEHLGDVDAEGNSPSFPHLKGLQTGDTASSRIKQVASGRFGVTPQFLVNSDQLEIKIAQGAKPGEGGQLPGKKVSPYIANLRRSKPGVPLISPPPHHDIYSIEDLAQLIFDLHMIAPSAKVSVKLVAQAGIGTVASGVAKANADVIQISGHDGGTGASPVSSIKHAGGPVEMGLAETHQSLVDNELRDRVTLRVDGGMRSGRDVLVSAALGGDEFGFGTVAMIATGCIMARVCHTNNCPVGVASQREELRARFPGCPGDLVNFFEFVAEEVRQGLASLGLRSLDELTGRADLLRQRENALAKTTHLDLSYLTTFAGPIGPGGERVNREAHSNGPVLDDELLADDKLREAIKTSGTYEKSLHILNTDRCSFARVAGVVAKQHGDFSFPGKLTFNVRGSAGQSFASFLVAGMNVHLVGEANDYVGKGMAGGHVSIVPPPQTVFAPEDASLVGNTCLYGATGGSLFVNGRAGERFAVRNSLADTVVEGAGDHCCEYMTGGAVVSLGSVGRNVGAGMTGGLAYFYDPVGDFPDKVNAEIVNCQRVASQAGQRHLQRLIERHVAATGSRLGQSLLDTWQEALPCFWQLVPPSEANTPEASPNAESEDSPTVTSSNGVGAGPAQPSKERAAAAA